MPDATKSQKINYIIAQIKDDLEKEALKVKEKKIKEKVEEIVE